MNEEDFLLYLQGEEMISDHTALVGFQTVHLIHADSSHVLKYLNANHAPVVYSDGDGFIMVKY